jgi:uncharacterized protein
MKNKLLFTILLFLLIPNIAFALEDGVTIPVVAYRSGEDGEKGVLLSAEVIVTRGTGHVFVDTSPYTQVDLQGSARLAAMVTSDVLGIDQRKYDFYYIIDIPSPIIGGPSAGGALTVATIAAVNNWTLKPGVVMTGMINPDESIGPVGGIPFKLEAVAASNATLFLIPEGQSKYTIQKNISKTQQPFIFYDTVDETIDLVKRGKELNITVREADTIREAVFAFTGHELKKPTYEGAVLTTQYINLLKPLATSLRKEAGDMYDNTEAAAPKNDLVKKAKETIDRADKMYGEEKYYAATSFYFNSMYVMRYIQWSEGYSKAENKEDYLNMLIDRVEKQIQQSESDLDEFKSNGVFDVEAVGAAESRITAARAKFDEALKIKSVDDKISSLAFANERARTAQWWLTLATPDGKTVPEEILKDRAGWYLSQAQSLNTYVHTLFMDSDIHPTLLSGTNEDIIHAQTEMQRGYYSGAIFDALQATVKSSTIIGLMGQEDGTRKIEDGANAAKLAINEARQAGVEPTLAVSAYEFGETMTGTYDQISQYTYSKMVARTSVVLNSYAVPSNLTPVKPTLTPVPENAAEMPTTPVITPVKDKTKIEVPAIGAVMAIAVLLFMGRKLKNR